MGNTIKVVYSEPADYFPEDLRRKYKLGEFAQSKELKQIKAVMLGHAVGDALGVPVEFCTREEIKENPVADMIGFGTYPYPAGTWSDDTSMSLCALEALSHEEWTWESIMNNFVSWLGEGKFTPTGETFDVGRTCLKSVMNYTTRKMPIDCCGGRAEHSNGNGSLMRINPFVLYAVSKKLDYWQFRGMIKRGSELTHAHERSVVGCKIYGYLLSFLLKEPTKDSLRRGVAITEGDLEYLPEFEHYKRIFSSDFESLSEDQINSSGYIVDSLEAAVWCVLTTDSYKDCVLKAVNLGGDTDTIAAIAGGLAGALYGLDSIPQEWLDKLAKRDYIEKMCEDACNCWKNVI